jgi:hypothetical protein
MDTPWKSTRGVLGEAEPSSAEIPVKEMRHFYARQLADIESAVSHAVSSSSIEGIDFDEEWQDVLRSVANGSQTAADAIQQAINRTKRT